jgi:hypothetical protein
VVRATVGGSPLAIVPRIGLKTKLGGDDYFFSERRESFTNDFFIGVGAVDFGGVKEGDATLKSGSYELDNLRLLRGGPKPKLKPMQPRPSAETSRPPFPSVRFCIISPVATNPFDT